MTGLLGFQEGNGWVPDVVPRAEERFDRLLPSNRPAKLNAAFQRLNAG